jgi:hypothetical protein
MSRRSLFGGRNAECCKVTHQGSRGCAEPWHRANPTSSQQSPTFYLDISTHIVRRKYRGGSSHGMSIITIFRSRVANTQGIT